MRRTRIIAITAVVCSYAAWATPVDTIDGLNKRGIALFEAAKYSEAEAEHRKAVEACRTMGPAFIPVYAASMNNLAASLQAQGKTLEARKAMEETIALEGKLGKYANPVLTHALNNLALLHHVEANLSTAASLLKKAMTTTPEDGITRAGTLHNLGAIYFDMGKTRQAEELFEQSLTMNLKAGGRHSLPPTYTYLARVAGMRGDVARAESLMQKGLEIRRELTPGHPNLAITLGDIGELYKDTKRYDKAIEHLTLALDILDSGLGKDHLYSAPILFQYGESLRLQGKYEQSLPYYERTIVILENAFGPQHARLATVFGSAAWVSAKLKHKEAAKDYKRRASAILEERVDPARHTVDVNAFLPKK